MHLLQWNDMPRHLQFNPYIMSGYRPLLSAWGCLNSIFYLHNETVNILTHGNLQNKIFQSCMLIVARFLVVSALNSVILHAYFVVYT